MTFKPISIVDRHVVRRAEFCIPNLADLVNDLTILIALKICVRHHISNLCIKIQICVSYTPSCALSGALILGEVFHVFEIYYWLDFPKNARLDITILVDSIKLQVTSPNWLSVSMKSFSLFGWLSLISKTV